MNTTKPFTYEIDPNYDYVLEEKGNTYTAIRKIKWGNSDEYKLDIRKYYASEEGERMSKGVSLMSDEGADELVKVLLDTGYGDDASIWRAINDSRPELMSMFIKQIREEDDHVLDLHLADYPVKVSDEELYDLGEVI